MSGMGRLKIAMIGQKGIPARYGGVETHVDKIATRLAKRGHEVWVFCRTRFMVEKRLALPYPDGELDALVEKDGQWFYHGVRLAARPSINTKHMDAATHSLLCSAEAALLHDFDVVHLHGIGPSAFAFIPKLAGKTVVTTVHALDWRQAKWGKAAKWALKRGERAGVGWSTGVIAVSRRLQDYLRATYGIEARYIPNGAEMGTTHAPRIIRGYGLEGDDYVLTVGRIIPDRRLHDVISAFTRLETDLKLVIVGEESPRTDYSATLERMADDRVIFTGNLYGDVLKEFYANCRLFVLASSVEGLPITACEAMAHGKGMLLSDIPENREVGGDAAEYFKCCDDNELYANLKVLLEDRPRLAALGEEGRRRVSGEYNWDRIAGDVEDFYGELVGRTRRRHES
jgi:glycosyltransferase involved in cell wall biosynthesis